MIAESSPPPSSCAKKRCCAGAAFITLVMAFAVIAAGSLVRDGLESFRMADRTVTVKGLAERDVQADLGVWSLSHSATGNDLAETQTQIESNGAKVMAFLKAQGFDDAEIDARPLQAQDLLAQSYRPEGVDMGRYIITQIMTIRTTDIEKMEKSMRAVGDLLRQGVTLATTNPPMYFFTKLNDIKPDMLADSTRNARAAAAEFADQSGASVGRIKEASQGLFQILPRDPVQYENEQNQRAKTVRVVSTITFYLD